MKQWEGKKKWKGTDRKRKREKAREGVREVCDAGANGRGGKKREEGRGKRGVYSLETSQALAISRHIFRMTSRL